MSLRTEAFHLLKRATSERFRRRLKAQVWRVRSGLAPVLKARYGTYGNAELEAELRSRIPSDFEILMVHSSISDMKPMYQGSAVDLLQMLQRFVGPARTLAMPAFFFGSPELYNRDYYRVHRRFDVRRTPSQMGLVTELFRRSPGVLRSVHPTHSVCARGPLAAELIGTHHQSEWPCGAGSPFGIMGTHRTAILGLGTEYYRSLTQVHATEDALADQFPIPREDEAPVVADLVDGSGQVIPYRMSRPLSSRYVLKLERLRVFMEPEDLREWQFRGTRMYLTDAARIDAAVRAAAMRGETLYIRRRGMQRFAAGTAWVR